MKASRLATRLPRFFRVNRPTTQTRTMAFFPRYSNAFGAELAPLFRLLDEGLNDVSKVGRHASIRAWAPRFDVKETEDSYTLEGELPGVEQKNVEIEFTDPHTLVIKGRTEYERTEGTPAVEDAPKAGAIENKTEESAEKSTAHQPSVEDENAPAASTSTEVAAPEQKSKEVSKPAETPKYKSWISERSVGEFHRSFSFPTRVNQDGVKASLKNGILSIVVPKSKAPESRRIQIE